MKELIPWLGGVIQRLDEVEARYAVVGGLAVSVRTELRFTRDIDLALAVDTDFQAEQAAGHLIRSGYRLVQELDQTAQARLATLRLSPPDATLGDVEPEAKPIVDLIFASCGIELETVAAATPFAVRPDLFLPVAQVPHLIAMKTLSASERRQQDFVDLQQLIGAAQRTSFPPQKDWCD